MVVIAGSYQNGGRSRAAFTTARLPRQGHPVPVPHEPLRVRLPGRAPEVQQHTTDPPPGWVRVWAGTAPGKQVVAPGPAAGHR
nr:hypothetical protein GCM10020063_015730 [Dactylosporangium thailandense]